MEDNKEEEAAVQISVLPQEDFQEMVVSMFKKFIEDETANPVLKVMKEVDQLQRQIDEIKDEMASYEKTCEVMLKHQETFLHKLGLLPKVSTRTVGVNVNIVPKVEKIDVKNVPNVNINLPLGTTLQCVPAANTGQKVIKTEPVAATLPAPPTIKQVVPVQKRNSVAFVDLTLEDDKARPKQIKIEPPKEKPQPPTRLIAALTSDVAKSQSVLKQPQRREVAVAQKVPTTAFVPTTMQQVVQIRSDGTQVVAVSANSPFPAPFVGTPKGMQSGLLPGQRITYLVQTNPPLNVLPPGLQGAKTVTSQTVTAARLPFGGHAVIGTARQITPSKNAVILTSPANTLSRSVVEAPRAVLVNRFQHPAPLPEQPRYSTQSRNTLMEVPPKPTLKISKPPSGIALSWNLPLTSSHAKIKSYQLYGYEETTGVADPAMWKKVGEMKALPLPMACTLTQFAAGRRYHFAIRAVDEHSRIGPFSDVANISLSVGSGSK